MFSLQRFQYRETHRYDAPATSPKAILCMEGTEMPCQNAKHPHSLLDAPNANGLVRSTGERVGDVVKADDAEGVEGSVDELRLPSASRGSEEGAVNTSRGGDTADAAGLAVGSEVRAADGEGGGRPDQAVVQVHVDAGREHHDGVGRRADAGGDGAVAGGRDGGCGGRPEDRGGRDERRVKEGEESEGFGEHGEGGKNVCRGEVRMKKAG
ncbi:hypothetical protein C8R46DRAFT_1095403 [Mycena filopes]|nr:hypothetical protein C8R46DRAFT_1095403 [Mycena filopes]